MVNTLLDFVAGGDGNWYFENRFAEGAIYALIGFAIVFAGIAIIIMIIWLEGLLMRKTNNLAFMHGLFGKIKKKLSRKKAEDISESVETVDGDEIPDEVKAAIIAAIMAYYSEEKPQCEFKVKRIKRI